jgi:hypothetical protein
MHSLREGLLGCPLEAVTALLPKGRLPESSPVAPEMLAEAFLHSQFQVSVPRRLVFFFFSFFLFLDIFLFVQLLCFLFFSV